MDELLRPWPRGRVFASRVRKAYRLLRECGLPALIYIARKKKIIRTLGLLPPGYIFSGSSRYEYWIRKNEPGARELSRLRAEARRGADGAKFALLLPIGPHDRAASVEASLASVLGQTDEHWELRVTRSAKLGPGVLDALDEISRDPRATLLESATPPAEAAALNAALRNFTGGFVAVLEPGDVLAPFALSSLSAASLARAEADLLYSDEDRISVDGKRRFDPHFKPDWSPDLLRSWNYVAGLAAIRKTLLESVGGFRAGYEGERHYDLILRVSEKARSVAHVQKILLHRPGDEPAEAAAADAGTDAPTPGRRALLEHVARLGTEADVLNLGGGRYRVRYRLKAAPEVSIIIATKDKAAVLKVCVDSILKNTSYPNYRIRLIDNQSREPETLRYFDELRRDPRVDLLSFDEPFNYSKLVNFGAAQAGGEMLLLLNNDTEILAPGWIEALLEHAQRKSVGAVGCLLRYPGERRVQHAGVIVGLGGTAGHGHHLLPGDSAGYFGRIQLVQNLSAVTAACLMTSREAFEEVGGFDARYSRALNDVDYCLRLRERGRLVVYTPYVDILHHESLSRGSDFTEEGWPIFKKALDDFEERWGPLLKRGDPYYNPGLSDVHGGFSLKI
ncbi:MAG: glycosyltransferase family 2 protein [Elusimicrobiota bacterium]